MNKDLVSIITPSYNSAEFIVQTIESVISQSHKNWEMIIVDDNSTDNTVQCIKPFITSDQRIQLYQLSKNCGTAVARNTAIQKAKGTYIAFLDSDDVWLPNKLEKQLLFMKVNDFNFSHTFYDVIDEKGTFLNKKVRPAYKMNYNKMLYSNKIGCLTAMYNAEKLGKVYMPNIRKRQDYALWLTILKKEKNVYCLQETLALYRDRSNSISNNKIEMLKWNWQLYRKEEKLSYVKSFFYITTNILNKLF